MLNHAKQLRSTISYHKLAYLYTALQQGQSLCPTTNYSTATAEPLNWVFLGPPGVGKGTYCSRIASALNIPHIATGDLVRNEIKSGSEKGKKIAEIVNAGNLLPDEVILDLLQNRIETDGKNGFILDGFPRRASQAAQLQQITSVSLAVNFSLREEILVEKCMGRRICNECGKNYNVADIYLPAEGDRPEIVMPPLDPPEQCREKMYQRDDDKEEVILRRLHLYQQEAKPVEEYYRNKGLLLDFEIVGGIPQTLPVLLKTLQPFVNGVELKEMTG
eukprot:TRINITY_DN2482_c0_g1_i1.p2 TRINITY_DN2482_c0_g1~~TRINITY_DN2482_c0_g1_i1.p2  ORF type:complete len:275 (-),score=30.40 TRINITY_DN2482_c0_g1_i1:214-1038(-)